jgi:hypothetical protein
MRSARSKRPDVPAWPRGRSLLAAAAVALLAIVVFAPVRHHDFVSLDDFEFVVDNPHVQQGLSLASVGWAFSPANAYVATGGPVTWSSHLLDVRIFGMTPGPAHVVNLALHALNAALLFLLLLCTSSPSRGFPSGRTS